MNWLITGGSGLIGTSLINIVDKKDNSYVVFDIKEKPADFEVSSNLNWVSGDIVNYLEIEKVIDEFKIDGIVHLASLLRNECAERPFQCLRINEMGFYNILEISVKKKIKKVVFISSVQVYGSESFYGQLWVDEEAQRKPQTLYGTTKVHVEDLAEYYKNNFGLNIVGLRFSTIYGYGRKSGPNTYLTDLITKAALGEDVVIPYKDNKQNLIYVKDAVESVRYCMNSNIYPRVVYNLCNDKLISNGDIAETLNKLLPDINISVTEGDLNIKGATPLTSPLFAEKELGYKLNYSLERSLLDYINEARKNKH